MRFIIVHKTNPSWEAGVKPSPELIQRVGVLIGELAASGALETGDGLRATSTGARLRFAGGERTIRRGPFAGEHEATAAFTIIRAADLDAAIEWASALATEVGDVELDVRPVTEAWDIGLGEKPPEVTTTRFMVQRKADAATETAAPPVPRLAAEAARKGGGDVKTVTMQPTRRGRRYKRAAAGGISYTDGPFTESKELIAGFVIVDVPSLADAGRLAERYLACVDTHEVDVLELA
jgi:hypothetical protein